MFTNSQLSERNGTSATISVGNWMGLDAIGFLNLIPFLGGIAVIVIYIIILCSSETAPSLKNRIIAGIIWACIGLVFFGVVLAIALAVGAASMNALHSILENFPNS